MLTAKKMKVEDELPPEQVGIVFKTPGLGGYYYGYYCVDGFYGNIMNESVRASFQIYNDNTFEFAIYDVEYFKDSEVEFWWNITMKLEE